MTCDEFRRRLAITHTKRDSKNKLILPEIEDSLIAI
jgi:hypothetical protein